MGKRKTHEEFMAEFNKRGNSNVIILERYVDVNTKILVKCKTDGHEWYVTPRNLLKGRGCPVCAGRTVIPHINSVAALRPDLLQYFENPDDAYHITPGSNNLVNLKCPDCGAFKRMRMVDFAKKSFICLECNSNISYPNRLIRCFMSQFKTELDYLSYELLDDWTNKQRYDVYFIKDGQRYVIEMQGGQHYYTAWNKDISIDEQIEKDRKKAELAIEHKIIPIIIDARISNFDFIFKNIQNSILGEIFDLSKFDVEQCRADATKNIIKGICKTYNENPNILTKELADLYDLSTTSIIRYLKQGAELGWCNYDPRESSLTSRVVLGKGVRVYDKDRNLIHEFYALLQCERELSRIYNKRFYRKIIKNVCDGIKESYHGFYFEYA